jgi:CRP/FNR family transcriptional regulator, cyclic AMP receptor protein
VCRISTDWASTAPVVALLRISEGNGTVIDRPQDNPFDPLEFLSKAGTGRRIVKFKRKESFFSQGEEADSVFYLQTGQGKVTVVSHSGKEAIIALLAPGDFVGEEAIAAVAGQRLATATAVTACTALKIQRKEMIRVIHEENKFSDLFLTYILARSMRTQADLIDRLFNSSEKRLARVLLLMAEFGKAGEAHLLIPKVSQEALANMIGATRSKVSFFMNRFRRLGFVEYNGGILVNKSLLNVVLHDQLSERSRQRSYMAHGDRTPPDQSKRGAVGQKSRRQNPE